jgi:uncharacterized protein (TIGR03000 family)
MFRQWVNRMRLVALAGLGLLLACSPAKAQQGWPMNGGNWDTRGGGFGGSSFRGNAPSFPTDSSPSFYSAYYYAPLAPGRYYASMTRQETLPAEARVNLRVPADAKVWFDGRQTSQAGTARSFESPSLVRGKEYAYQVRIQWKRDGKDVTETRRVDVHAGDVINLTAGSSSGAPLASGSANAPPAPGEDYAYGTLPTEAATKLPARINLSVPADAKIWFDGSPTQQTGIARSFESQPLDRGKAYGYQIRVQWKRDGKDVTKTRQVDLHAGDVINLTLGSSSGSPVAGAPR